MEKIKLALLWPKYGGDVTSVNDLITGLDRQRFDVVFIYLRGNNVERNYLHQAGYQVIYLSDKEKLGSLNLAVLLKLRGILKKHDIDILHCHAHKATVYGAIAAKLAGTPIVLAHVHGLNRSRTLRRKIVNYFVHKKINKIICVANGVKENVLKDNKFLSKNEVLVLENSVDYDFFADDVITRTEARVMLGLSEEAFIFATAGRLAPTKGLPYLIDAFIKVKAQKPSSELVILGEGPSRIELEQQAADTPCKDSIHFLGHRAQIRKLYRGMDVFVLSSIAEGMPRTILEAMAAGVPCVATKVGGIPEIINSEDVGILVDSANSESLAEGMLRVAEMPGERCEQIVKQARQRVRDLYSHKVVGERLRKIYESEFENLR